MLGPLVCNFRGILSVLVGMPRSSDKRPAHYLPSAIGELREDTGVVSWGGENQGATMCRHNRMLHRNRKDQ